MSDIIERVALAIWHDRYPGDPEWTTYDKIDFLGHASAAIKAMREPVGGRNMWSAEAIDLYQRMIDAAMTAGKGTET